MNIKRTLPIALAALLAVGVAGGTAYAGGTDEDREATALLGAKVKLVEAIGIAERQTGGQAFDAGVDVKDGQTGIAVETNSPKGVQTVVVSAETGQVVAAHAGGVPD